MLIDVLQVDPNPRMDAISERYTALTSPSVGASQILCIPTPVERIPEIQVLADIEQL